MIFEIEHFYRESDGNDWLPAITRAQNEWHVKPPVADDYRGFTLLFGPREYQCSGSIELIRGMSLVGSGAAVEAAGTILKFPAGMHGIICHVDTTAPIATPGLGRWSIVERVQIQAEAGSASTQTHGVLMHAGMTLRDVFIRDFAGDGIHIQGDHTATPPTNANHWQIQNCRVNSCDNGLFVQGPDTNAGCAIALDCSANRKWGIDDQSFLGNTYVACHTAGNGRIGNGSTFPDIGGAYRCIGSDARSLFLNCYSEGGQPPSQMSNGCFVLGGYIFPAIEGKGVWLDSAHVASFANGVRGLSPKTPGKPDTAAVLGSHNVGGVALELHRLKPKGGADPEPYRFHYGYRHPGWWELVFADLNAAIPLRFSTEEAPEGWGQLWMENGYFIGGGRNRVQVQTGSEPPSAEGHRGDIVYNTSPHAGGYIGWVCVPDALDPLHNKWQEFGQIKP